MSLGSYLGEVIQLLETGGGAVLVADLLKDTGQLLLQVLGSVRRRLLLRRRGAATANALNSSHNIASHLSTGSDTQNRTLIQIWSCTRVPF